MIIKSDISNRDVSQNPSHFYIFDNITVEIYFSEEERKILNFLSKKYDFGRTRYYTDFADIADVAKVYIHFTHSNFDDQIFRSYGITPYRIMYAIHDFFVFDTQPLIITDKPIILQFKSVVLSKNNHLFISLIALLFKTYIITLIKMYASANKHTKALHLNYLIRCMYPKEKVFDSHYFEEETMPYYQTFMKERMCNIKVPYSVNQGAFILNDN